MTRRNCHSPALSTIPPAAWTLAACLVCCWVCLILLPCSAQERLQRRGRGESLFLCQSGNTPGAGTVWIEARGLGLMWDDPYQARAQDPDDQTAQQVFGSLRAFPELRAEAGPLGFLSLTVESRPLTWSWTFGWVAGAVKATLPNNKDLRVNNPGLDIRYQYNATEGPPTLGGYFGFMPEGYVTKGSVLQAKLLYDADFIALRSFLPFKAFVNAGARIPLVRDRIDYSQYLASAGISYIGYMADVFVEYSMENFFNLGFDPKLMEQTSRRWQVAFTENPMYLTIGGRVRYTNGITLFLCVPLLISSNVGSAMTEEDKTALEAARHSLDDPSIKFHDEAILGITDPFDPWYAKWKVVASLSFPILYRQTASEMRRTYLLMKNTGKVKRIDIDDRLKAIQDKAKSGSESDTTQSPVDAEADKQRRLEEIKKRREEMKK